MSKRLTTGFTLIELLIVIAIIAILSVVVVLALNPAELLRQTRDSTRTQDLSTVQNAISFFVADNQSFSPGATCRVTTSTTPGANCGGWFTTAFTTATTSNARGVDGTGWVNINFGLVTSGSPIPRLPLDPVNNTSYFYAYGATSTFLGFKVAANMESTRYASGGSGDVESTDGGSGAASSSLIMEAGTNLAL